MTAIENISVFLSIKIKRLFTSSMNNAINLNLKMVQFSWSKMAAFEKQKNSDKIWPTQVWSLCVANMRTFVSGLIYLRLKFLIFYFTFYWIWIQRPEIGCPKIGQNRCPAIGQINILQKNPFISLWALFRAPKTIGIQNLDIDKGILCSDSQYRDIDTHLRALKTK